MLDTPIHYEFYTKRTGAKIEFESCLELSEAASILMAERSEDANSDFRRSLLASYAMASGNPPENIRNWIIKLAQETLTGPIEAIEPPGELKNLVHFINALGVKELHLPVVVLSKTGERSKNPGAIYVYWRMGRKYLGKITKAGNLVFNSSTRPRNCVSAERDINDLIESPFQGLNDSYPALLCCPFDKDAERVFPDQPNLYFSKRGLTKAVGPEIVKAVAESKDPLGTLKELFKYLPEQKQVEPTKLEANKEFDSGSPESSIFNALKNL